MDRYAVEVAPRVWDDLKKLPKADVRRIVARLEKLRDDPRPPGAEKLKGSDEYRVRQGDYRIVYTVHDVIRLVRVARVGNRRDVYRRR
jgi:mRNA interferase RelE/StbE